MKKIVMFPNKTREEKYNYEAVREYSRKLLAVQQKLAEELNAYERFLSEAEANLTPNELNILIEINEGGNYEKERNRVSRFRDAMKL